MAGPQASTGGSTGAATKGPILDEAEDESVPIWGWLFNSDSTPASPWARKIILSLDGGGVRGYASLRILDRLMERVRLIEEEISENRRQERQRLQQTVVERDKLCEHSGAYRWSKPPHRPNGQLPQQNGEFKPHQYIDYFVGTSTGGLSVMMLGRLQMTVSEALAQYDIIGAEVFGRPRAMTWKGRLAPRFKSKHMDLALQGITRRFGNEAGQHTNDMILRAGTTFGANGNNGNGTATNRQRDHAATLRHQADRVALRNGNVDTARTVVVAHGTWDNNLQTRRPLLFRSYDHPPPNITSADSGRAKHHKPFAASDLPLWKIGRATSAAPTYFSPMVIGEHKIRDGAIGLANNPILLAYEEVKQVHWKNEPCLIISIGTGIPPPGAMQQGRALIPAQENLREALETSKWFQKLVLDSESKHEEFKRQLEGEYGINSRLTSQGDDKILYYRFNVPFDHRLTDIKLGDWHGTNGNDTKIQISTAVDAYLESVRDQLATCARKMVEVRRERQKTERWERFALNLVYACPEGMREGSQCEGLLFSSRAKLRQHAIRTHGLAWKVPCVDTNNRVTHDWACYWDHCGENRVSVFETEFEFRSHLAQVHMLEKPHVMSRRDIEEWLDKGRRVKPPLVSPTQTGLTQHTNG